MSSSPEQSSAGPLNISHNASVSSMTSMISVGSGGDSPPHLLSPPRLAQLTAASSSTPNSPHLSGRPASGNKKGKGMKRMKLRKHPTPSTPQVQPPTVHEDPLESAEHANKALFLRMLRIQPKKIRNFRRGKRRDKQYHSDDGYTSDPGILREEEDDETDENTDTNEGRRLSQMRDLERKLEKAKRSLKPDEEDDSTSTVELQGDNVMSEGASVTDKSQNRRLKFNKGIRMRDPDQQQRKKIEKLETQLRLLQEGGTLESRYSYSGSGLRGRIPGSLRVMSFAGLKDRITTAGAKLRRKRYTTTDTVVDEEVLDVDEMDDDPYPEVLDENYELAHDSAEVLCAPEAHQSFAHGVQLIPALKEGLDSVRESSEEYMQEFQKMKREMDMQKEQLTTMVEDLALLVEKLEQEKERAERLEGQVNDITELHQHEVGELRTQLAQMENMTMSKSQDLEDAMEACQAKMDRLDAHVHQLIDNEEPVVRSMVRAPLVNLLSAVLVLFAFLLKVVSVLKTKPGLVVAMIVIVVALLYFVFRYH